MLNTMRGRDAKGPPSADLLVCFPSRAHLSLMPKPICSPSRASESTTRRRHHHHHSYHHHRLKKSIHRGGGSAGQASPLLWAKSKTMSSDIDEPTSPKVTCAGQIKVRHKPNACKNWQSVMEEIERLHSKKQKRRHTWVEALGFKKDIMQFLTCLRSIRLDFRCFGSFPAASDITSDDEDEEEDEDFQENRLSREGNDDNEASRTVFSKWFMVLQENQYKVDGEASCSVKNSNENANSVDDHHAPCAPPSNALLLMRCRSAPAKSWVEEMEREDDEEEEENRGHELAIEEEKKKKQESPVVMRYNTDFAKLSTDTAKETWVVGGIKDPLSRSRSWKR